MEVYLDNSSTTFPKPKQVINAMCDYMLNVGGNAGRGNYSNSLQSNRYLYDARELICNFFGYDSPSNVIFYKQRYYIFKHINQRHFKAW